MAATKFLFALVVALCASQVVLADAREKQLRIGLSDISGTVQEVLAGIRSTLEDAFNQAKEFVKDLVASAGENISNIVHPILDKIEELVEESTSLGVDVTECTAQQQGSISDTIAKLPDDINSCVQDLVQRVRDEQEYVDDKLRPELSELQDVVAGCSQAGGVLRVIACLAPKSMDLVQRTTSLIAEVLERSNQVQADFVELISTAGSCSRTVIVERVDEVNKIFKSTVECIRDKLD